MRARIRILDRELQGAVSSIANQPEPTSFFSASVKEYGTIVKIDGQPEGLRPGMTAEVEILVAHLKDVLTLPVAAVVEQRGKYLLLGHGGRQSGTPSAGPGPEQRPVRGSQRRGQRGRARCCSIRGPSSPKLASPRKRRRRPACATSSARRNPAPVRHQVRVADRPRRRRTPADSGPAVPAAGQGLRLVRAAVRRGSAGSGGDLAAVPVVAVRAGPAADST